MSGVESGWDGTDLAIHGHVWTSPDHAAAVAQWVDVTEAGGGRPRPELIGTFAELRLELDRLRVWAARGRGKLRLSLRDISAASGIPRTTLANYLSGASAIPADQLDALVLALGATPAEAAVWATAWERAMNDRLAGMPDQLAQDDFRGRHVQYLAVFRRRPMTALVIGVAVALVAGVAVYLLRGNSPPGPTNHNVPRCWPVTGDWNEPNNPRDHATRPGSETVGVACKVGDDNSLPWTGTDNLVDAQPRSLGGYGNSDICIPVAGDWNGDGVATAGLACRDGSDGHWIRWSLINSFSGSPFYPRFRFGSADACWPVAGDWDGDGRTGVGVACREGNGIRWSLTNALAAGDPSYQVFEFGDPDACRPVAGDWDGDGRAGVGVACRDGDTMRWSLTNSLSGGGPSYPPFTFGDFASCLPVTGDWDGDGATTVGVACYTTGGIRWSLINAHTAGMPSYPPFVLGNAGTFPLGGGWRGPSWPQQS